MPIVRTHTATCVVCMVLGTAVCAQQNTFQPAALPNAAKPAAAAGTSGFVPTLPEQQLFKGVDLTPAQRAAMLANIGSANVEWVPKSKLTPQDVAGQRLPSSDGNNLVLMQQLVPPPGTLVATDACDTPGISDPDIAGLKRLLSSQLRTTGGDPAGLDQPELAQCRRSLLSFYLKVASKLAGSPPAGGPP